MTQLTLGSANAASDNAPPAATREGATTNERADDFAALLAALFVAPAPVSPSPLNASEAVAGETPGTQLQIIDGGGQTIESPRGAFMPFTFGDPAPGASEDKSAAIDESFTVAAGETVSPDQAALNAAASIVNFAADGNLGNQNIDTQGVMPHQLAAFIADGKANSVAGDSQSSFDPDDPLATLESHGLVAVSDVDASYVGSPSAAFAAVEPVFSPTADGFSLEDLRAGRRLISAAEINSLLESEKTNGAVEAAGMTTHDGVSTFANSFNGQGGDSFRAIDGHAPAIVSQTASALAAEFASLSNSKTADARSLRLDLAPESLGRIAIRLERDAEGRISAHLTADTDATHETLSDSLGEIRRTLEDAGVNVARLDVGAGGNFGASAETADERRARTPANERATGAPTITPDAPGRRRVAAEDRLLSLRA